MRNYSTFGEISLFQKIRSLDFYLIISLIILGLISIMAMYSTDISDGNFYHTLNHAIRFGVFFVFMIILSFVNIKYYFLLSFPFYVLILILLIAATFFGTAVSGSQRWINLYFLNLQPSELMKIAIIVCFARYYHRIQSAELQSYRYLLIPIVLLVIPCYLVVMQPDLGTSILIAGSGIVVIWIAGLNIKYFVYTGLLLLVSFPFIVSVLKPYQKSRILTFFNPDRDPLGAGYQIIQSKIAIGSGGLFGKGFLNGSQSYLDYLPEKHTDFIFTLFSEEFGFFGSFLILMLYSLIIHRIVKIGHETRSTFGKLYCYSFATAFFFYVAVNMGMVLGLLPIVGAPLPILSYGGSSMMAIMIGLGIVMSCKIYKDTPVN